MNKKAQLKSIGSTIIISLITIVLIGVIASLLRAETQVDCFNAEYPYLNSTDKYCYNSTTGDLDKEVSTIIGLSITEKSILGLIILFLILSIIVGLRYGGKTQELL